MMARQTANLEKPTVAGMGGVGGVHLRLWHVMGVAVIATLAVRWARRA
jgi:hypothetical protein